MVEEVEEVAEVEEVEEMEERRRCGEEWRAGGGPYCIQCARVAPTQKRPLAEKTLPREDPTHPVMSFWDSTHTWEVAKGAMAAVRAP